LIWSIWDAGEAGPVSSAVASKQELNIASK
jgi:hypothetical protein